MLTSPLIYYWSASTGGTASIAGRLTTHTQRITPTTQAEQPYILMVPSYGSPRTKGHTPKAVKDFLRGNHQLMVGVIGTGNLAFGEDYCAAAYSISARFQVPIVWKVDLRGTGDDISEIDKRVHDDWQEFITMKGQR